MGEYLQGVGVEETAMESTGISWIPVWNILGTMGFNITGISNILEIGPVAALG